MVSDHGLRLGFSFSADVPQTLVLHPDGDIIFLVGPEEAWLRVHSLFLKAASPVFAAMFGPRFSEGQGLNSNDPKEVKLPDDEAWSIFIMCAIIHHRRDVVPAETPKPELLLQLGVTAEKYDCVDEVQYACSLWLRTCSWSVSLEDAGYCLATAYVLGDGTAFRMISRSMIWDHIGSYASMVATFEDVLPTDLFYRMAEKRAAIRTEIYKLIMRICKFDKTCGSPDCLWPIIVQARVQAEFQKVGLWPFADITLTSAMDKLDSIHYDENTNLFAQPCNQVHKRSEYDWAYAMLPKLRSLKRMGSWCLECEKPGITCTSHVLQR